MDNLAGPECVLKQVKEGQLRCLVHRGLEELIEGSAGVEFLELLTLFSLMLLHPLQAFCR